MSAKARKTAISSVHGERRSSSSSARPLRVEPLAGRGEHLLGVASRLGRRINTRDVQRRGPFPRRRVHVGGRISGGQRHVVARPRSWVAMRTASVVLPTPPLPIVITTPLPRTAICSTS